MEDIHKLNARTKHANVTQITAIGRPSNETAVTSHKDAVEMQTLLTDENAKDSNAIKDQNVSERGKDVPIDRGWAWMVLLGATLEMLFVVGFLKSSGIFFVAFQERFGSSSSVTSLINTVENGVWSVSALIVMTVGMKFLSGRSIHMIGSIALCLSYVISSRAEDVRVLLLSFGAIKGVGMACMEPVSITMIGNYFDKRLGLANSIANSGGSLGGLVFAPLVTAMFQHYGYSGTMLLCGAFFLHGFVSGALFRPQTFYTNRRKTTITKSEINNTSENALLKNGASKSIEFIRQHLQVNSNPPKAFGSASSIQFGKEYRPNSNKRKRTYTDSEAVKALDPITRIRSDNLTSAEYLGGSQYDIPAVIHFGIGDENHTDDSKIVNHGSLCSRICTKHFDFSLFKNPVFLVFLIGAGILCTPHALCILFLAPHAKDMGIEAEGIATLYTVNSAIDMCARIIIGAIADKKWIRRSTMIGIGSCSIGLLSNLMRFFTAYEWLMFYVVVFGLIGGTYFTLYSVVIIDYLTLANLQSCLGVTILLQAVIVSSSFPVLGLLRDSTGSYIPSFHLLGTMALVGGLLMISLPLVERCYKHSRHTERKSDVSTTK